MRHGCVVPLTLFNLYFGLVIEQWRTKCSEIGVDVLYKCGGRLVRQSTRRPSKVRVTVFLFADDAAAVGTSREGMEYAALELEKIVRAWGLTLSVGKTKVVVAGAPSSVEDLNPRRWRN